MENSRILLCIDRCEMKNLQPLLLFFTDENEKLLISEVLQARISVGNFTSTSSFDIRSLQFVTINKLLFTFYLVDPYHVYFLLEFEATSHNKMFVGRWGECIYL